MAEETSLSCPAPPYKRGAPGGGGEACEETQRRREIKR